MFWRIFYFNINLYRNELLLLVFLLTVKLMSEKTLLCLISAEKEHNPSVELPSMQYNSNVIFSSRYSTFNCALSTDSELRCVCFPTTNYTGYSNDPTNTKFSVMSGIFISESNNKLLHKNSFLIEYDYSRSENSPIRILFCEEEISCCCYSTSRSGQKFVVAGMTDGSCVLWCLNESTSEEPTKSVIRWNDQDILLLRPSFDTSLNSIIRDSHLGIDAFLLNRDTTTDGAVLSVHALRHKHDLQEESFVSLHANGVIVVWAVRCQYYMSASIQLGPSTYSLIRTNTIRFSDISGRESKREGTKITCLEIFPEISSHRGKLFLIGTDKGCIMKVKCTYADCGGTVLRRYSTHERNTQFGSMIDILNIRLSPVDSDFFAAGCADSRVFLFHQEDSLPLRILYAPDANLATISVTHIEWATGVDNILYVTYGSSNFAVYRLHDPQDKRPYSVDIINFKSEFRQEITCSALCCDESGNSYMVFGLSPVKGGNIAVHCLEHVAKRNESTLQQLLRRHKKFDQTK